MGDSPSSSPDLTPTPTPSAPAATPAVVENENWANTPESAELIGWKRRTLMPKQEEDLNRIDKLLNDHLDAKEYVDAYDGQKAKAVQAMQLYIKRAYEICMIDARRNDMNSEGRRLWNEKFFKEYQEDVNQYFAMITAFLLEMKTKNKVTGKGEKISLDNLFDLAERGREIYWKIAKEPRYAEILKKITSGTVHPEKLDPADYDFIIDKFPERKPGEVSADDSMQLLESSGVSSIMYAMNFQQRRAFAEYIIESRSRDRAITLITSLASSKYLTNAQLEGETGSKGLYNLMREKGLFTDEKQEQDMKTTINIGQAKSDTIRANISKNIRADMSTNQAIKFMQPRYLAGAFLMVWRGTNAALSLIAYRNDLSEYLKSPWLYADIAGIVAGSALLGNPAILDWIKDSVGQKDLPGQAEKLAVCEMISDKPGMTDKYFARPLKKSEKVPGLDETGMVELLTMIRGQKEKKKERMNVTVEEMLKYAEGGDPKTKGTDTVIRVNQTLIDQLREIRDGKDTSAKSEFERYATAICGAKKLGNTHIFHEWIDDLKRIQGVK